MEGCLAALVGRRKRTRLRPAQVEFRAAESGLRERHQKRLPPKSTTPRARLCHRFFALERGSFKLGAGDGHRLT